jgi:hypothetical protein
MKVYTTGTKPARQPSFIMSIAPAATVSGDVPSNWVDDKNNPVQFNIEFKFGEAEVEDGLGKYLVENGLVRLSRLVLPRELSDEELMDAQLRQLHAPHGG